MSQALGCIRRAWVPLSRGHLAAACCLGPACAQLLTLHFTPSLPEGGDQGTTREATAAGEGRSAWKSVSTVLSRGLQSGPREPARPDGGQASWHTRRPFCRRPPLPPPPRLQFPAGWTDREQPRRDDRLPVASGRVSLLTQWPEAALQEPESGGRVRGGQPSPTPSPPEEMLGHAVRWPLMAQSSSCKNPAARLGSSHPRSWKIR